MKKDKLIFLNQQYSLPKMFIPGVILLLIYVLTGRIILVKLIPQPWNSILYMLIALGIAGICAILAETTQVLKVRPKQGKVMILSVILVMILAYIYLSKAFGWVMIFRQGWMETLVCLSTAIGAGFAEEFIFRNLFFNAFIGVFKKQKYTLLLASITVSAIFGLMHFINLTHQAWGATSQQVFYAFAIGMLFCTIHIWSNTMLIPAMMHFLFDFSPIIKTATTTVAPWIGVLIIFLPILVISFLWILFYNKKVNELR